jgi:hypothetical protein
MGVDVVPASLDGSANTLLELAGLFQAGRPEPALTDRAGAPKSHPEVGDAAKAFAGFAFDQYQDGVALLAALSMRLAEAAAGYAQTDSASAASIDRFLEGTTYRPAGQ